MILLELFIGFLKVGCFAFGGAYGAIPLIRDVVLSYPEDSRQPKRLKPDTGDCPHCLIRHRGQSPVSY